MLLHLKTSVLVARVDSLKLVLQLLLLQAEWTELSESPHHGAVFNNSEGNYQEENRSRIKSPTEESDSVGAG